MPIVDGHLVIDGYTFSGGDGSDKSSAVEVTTFRQLLDANDDADMNNKYIKVMNNIDVSSEDWYKVLGYTSRPTYKNYIYADIQKIINGLTVIGNSGGFFHTGASNGSYPATFENLSFLNCVYKVNDSVTSANTGILNGGSSSPYYVALKHVNLSLRLVHNGYNMQSVNRACSEITDCSFYISCSDKSSTISTPFALSIPMTRTNYILDGFSFSMGSSSSGSVYNQKCQSCSYIFKNCSFTNGTYMFNTGSTNIECYQTYFAFQNCTFSSTPITVKCTRNDLIASDMPDGTFVVDASSATQYCTNTQLKSKQYLIDIGFLP